ncbi:MAG: hypothetical protein NZM12_05150, partial [Steroidobacteraceae bacterium]|nr:hypothetical protein [Steroidobacteraceae bacterium]
MTDTFALTLTAATIAVAHTAAGPDHYIPFVALGEARGWSLRRTLWTTAACGLGHTGASLLLALAAAAGGWSLSRISDLQEWRGDTAAWLLLALGVAYAAWGWTRRHRRAVHTHLHAHSGGIWHTHEHDHRD